MQKLVYCSPRKYVQGKGVLDELGGYLADLVGKDDDGAFIIADDFVWTLTGERIRLSLTEATIRHDYQCFKGESSETEIVRLASLARHARCGVIVGLGGGKTLDTAKAVANELQRPVAIVPTVASTDAPCSAISVIYSDDGVFEGYRHYRSNPELVLVDSGLCASAPLKLFASGIADGLSTWVEARAVLRAQGEALTGGRPSIAALAIARACQETLFDWGISACDAVLRHQVTPAVEAVIEANTLLSGIGFENGGLATAHGIHNGFSAVKGEIHRLSHGEKVAYGTLAQLVLEQAPEQELARFIRFFRAIGMPVTLAELHLDPTDHALLVQIGNLTCRPANGVVTLYPHLCGDDIAAALMAVDAISHRLLATAEDR